MLRARLIVAMGALPVLFAIAPAARAQPVPPPADAPQTDEARRLAREEYAQGKAAFEAGDYLRAAALFQSAYRRAPHHDALWNAARALELAGEKARAANLYTEYLTVAPPEARDRDRATSARKTLAESLGAIAVHGAVEAVQIDGQPVGGDTVYVDPGEHVLRGRVNGSDVRRVVMVQAGMATSVVFDAAAPVSVPSPAATAAPAPSPAHHRPLSPWFFVVGAGLTAVAGGLAIASGVDTLSARSSYDAMPSSAALDAGRYKEDRTNVLFWSTAGLGVVSGVLAIFLVDFRGSSASARVGLDAGRAFVAGDF